MQATVKHQDTMPPTWHDDEPANTMPKPNAIPANLEAERAVIGSCLIDPDALAKVATFLRPQDFFRERHGWIFDAMLRLNAKREPIDFVTLADELETMGRYADIGPAYITDILAAVPTAMYVEYYGHIVEETSIRRQMIAASGKTAELAYDETVPLKDAINQAEQTMFGISAGRIGKDMSPINAIMRDVVERIDFLSRNPQALGGVPTGFTVLDRLLGGLQKSDLIILAARPGMGKTAFALSVANHAAKTHASSVAFFSLEMSKDQLAQRLLSMESGVDSHRLRMGNIHPDEWTIMLEAANVLANTNVMIDDTPAASINEIRTKARRLYADGGLDLIVIDYMQLMSGQSSNGRGQENRQQEISYISRSLKNLARELNVPIVALSQLSRAVEQRADKRPMLSDLRESGSIEADADVVLFVYREDYYVEDTDRQNIADILVAKHRHGATGTVSLYFRKELTQFRDLEIQRTDLEY